MVEFKCFIPAARIDISYQLSSPCQSSRYGMSFAAPPDYYKSCFSLLQPLGKTPIKDGPQAFGFCVNEMDQSRKPIIHQTLKKKGSLTDVTSLG
jgi:hypothetical protein